MYPARLLFAVILSAAAAPAQIVTGSVSGTVADSSGSAVAAASLRLISETTGAARETTSDANGNFVFSAIQPGTYTLTVEQTGFKKHEKKNVALTANESLSVGEIRLAVGDVAESVTVTADPGTVQTASGERSGIITAEEVENLTVINRDFSVLVALQPGVVDNPGTAEVQGFSGNATFNVLGGRTTGNNIAIDGTSTENTNASNPNNFVSMDSVSTVRIMVSNYQAEFGRKPGASIMAVTKSGASQFHGAVYHYYRHEWMNANSFFNNRDGVAPTPRRIQTPGGNLGGPLYIPGKFNRNRDKLFFFVSTELIRERRPQDIRRLTMPSALEREGDFSNSRDTNSRVITVWDPLNNRQPFAGNVVPVDRINASGKNYLKLLPLPNVDPATTGYRYNYQVQESLTIPKIMETVRIDYRLDQNTTVWGRFNYWREEQQGWAVSAGNANWGWLPNTYTNRSKSAVLALTRILSPSLILEASMGVTRWIEDGSPLHPEDLQRLNRKNAGVDIPQFHPENNPYNLVPQAQFGGVSNSPTTSLNNRFPLRGAETPFVWNAAMTKTSGPHVSKLGLFIERWRAIKGENGNWAGTINFGRDTNNPNDSNHPFANALLGNFNSYTESTSRPPMYEYTTSVEWFAQDNWKLTRRLTLDAGVRFGWSSPFHSNRRQESGFVPERWDPARTVMLMQPVRINNVRQAQNPITGERYPATVIGALVPGAGDPSNGTVDLQTDLDYPAGLRQNTGIKTAPRFGFAWDPFGKGRTAIRGGFGIFYEIHEKDNWAYALVTNPPHQYNPTIYYGNIDTFIQSSGFIFPSNTRGMDAGRALGRTMSFSFGLQQNIGWGTILDASYVASLGRHLVLQRNLNATPLGTNFLASSKDPSNPSQPLAVSYLRPYLGYGDIPFNSYNGNSSYHSLQVSANRRARKVQYGLAWTWSKAMDYADNDTANVSNLISNRVWNYGKAGFDRTHIVKMWWIWDVPRVKRLKAIFDGWQLSGINTFMSGAPAGIGLGFAYTRDTTGSTDGARVNVIEKPVIPRGDRTFSRNFNTNAFQPPAIGTWGNAAKDVIRGPGINNWDVSLFKNFRLSERKRAQFRLESYNTYNHTQFSGLDTSTRFDQQGNQTNTRLGEFTSARAARRTQLALRVTF